MKKVLIVQTAFLGDVILTLPLVQVIKKLFPSVRIDMIVIPASSDLLQHHPDVDNILVYDKRGSESGLRRFLKKVALVQERRYDVAFVPHRSLRSATLVRMARIPTRVGFDRSAGRKLFTRIVKYESSLHEIERNLRLLGGIGVEWKEREYPRLYPSSEDRHCIDALLARLGKLAGSRMIAVAPGTVWNTKRWPKERFAELVAKLALEHLSVVLIGGKMDSELCAEIAQRAVSSNVVSTAGTLSLLQSAELIRRCSVMVCNDSAPTHLAIAVGTPVITIFGATTPEFGFAPYGMHDVVIETKGLSCRPCSIHGGDACPIKTFDCMMNISSEQVFNTVQEMLRKVDVRL